MPNARVAIGWAWAHSPAPESRQPPDGDVSADGRGVRRDLDVSVHVRFHFHRVGHETRWLRLAGQRCTRPARSFSNAKSSPDYKLRELPHWSFRSTVPVTTQVRDIHDPSTAGLRPRGSRGGGTRRYCKTAARGEALNLRGDQHATRDVHVGWLRKSPQRTRRIPGARQEGPFVPPSRHAARRGRPTQSLRASGIPPRPRKTPHTSPPLSHGILENA